MQIHTSKFGPNAHIFCPAQLGWVHTHLQNRVEFNQTPPPPPPYFWGGFPPHVEISHFRWGPIVLYEQHTSKEIYSYGKF